MSLYNLHTHHFREGALAILNQAASAFESTYYQHPSAHFSLGIHPWFIPTNFDYELALLRQFATHPKVLAIGEAGLDKICETPFDLQLTVFEKQIALANELDLPMILHGVKAYPELIALKKTAHTPWILHGFRGKPELAKQLIAAGFYLSFGKGIELLSDTIKMVPLNRLFLETDDNEIDISENYVRVSDLLSISATELEQQIEENFAKVFGEIYF